MAAAEQKTQHDEDRSDSLVAMLNQFPPRSGQDFDWNVPTNEAYHDKEELHFTTPFQQARAKLDYSYHLNPRPQRQQLQDKILEQVLKAVETARQEQQDKQKRRRRPWILFTAGAMAAGKSYALSQLHERGLFPLNEFVAIDPDKIKSQLPEMSGYLAQDPASAATKLHRESTQMADVLFEYALLQSQTSSGNGLDILVDGSLRDVAWYKKLFQRIRQDYPSYRLAIIHVSASPEVIRRRAAVRAELSGRAVPEALLQESMEQVPRSVETLSPLTDVTVEISNNDDHPIQLTQFTTRAWNDRYSKNDSVAGEEKEEHSLFEPQERPLNWNEFAELWTDVENEEFKRDTTQTKSSFFTKLTKKWFNKESKQDSTVTTQSDTSCSSSSVGKMTCHLLHTLSNANKSQQQQDSFQRAWSQAFPNACSRCMLMDGHADCGPCIHNNVYCKCPLCHPNMPPCAQILP